MIYCRRVRLGGFCAALLGILTQIGCQGVTSPQNTGMLNTGVYPGSDGRVPNGQQFPGPGGAGPAAPAMLPPSELSKVSHAAYRIEPPDVLLIDAVRLVPKPPYYIQSLDILQVVVAGTLPDQPIGGAYQVAPDGTVNLGPAYGSVKVAGLTTIEATDAMLRRLRRQLAAPEVSISLLQVSGQQQIAGEHLVGPDGTVNLGVYGSVYVAGQTIDEARQTIEKHLEKYLDAPRVAIDMFSYNSKVYYIILEGGDLGDQVMRVPVTGNETVLDAISQVGGLSRLSSKKMWIARRSPLGKHCDQMLPVDWVAITKGGQTATNYQILPGDRVFVQGDHMVMFEAMLQKLTAPFERIFGFTLLGGQTIQVLQRFPKGNQNF